jgi:hypothetical protein
VNSLPLTPVAEIHQMLEQIELVFGHGRLLQINLNLARRILDVGEHALAHVAMAHQSARQSHLALGRRIGSRRGDGLADLEPPAVRIDPLLQKFLALLQSRLHQLVNGFHDCRENTHSHTREQRKTSRVGCDETPSRFI